MLKRVLWFTVWALTLGYVSITATYTDGTVIKYNGWGKAFNKMFN